MIKVFTAVGRVAPLGEGVRFGLIALLAGAWMAIVPAPVPAQEPTAKKAGSTADAPKGETPPAKDAAKADAPPAKDASKDAADDDDAKPVVDPFASHKAAALDIYKDPNVDGLLDPKKFPEIRAPKAATDEQIAQLKQMAASPLVAPDANTITDVVNGMIGQMTNTRNIQAVLDPTAEKNLKTVQAVQAATQNLLEPVFTSRSAKNAAFQTRYNQILLQKLPPVFKHHLIPRIQAMIILAQSANPDALKVLLDEIKSPTQTVWVKLWAFRGITNIKLLTNRLSASQEADAAKAIAEQLGKGKAWPAWVQYRALESLTALRQGFLPTSPRTADMAAVAFQYLIDDALRPEVRSQAALALGSMQITSAVPKYNFEIVAYATAQLGASILDKMVNSFSENPIRAQQLTTVLVGPVFQAFEGQAGVRDSGLLNNSAVTNKADIQKYFDALKPVAKAASALIGAPTGQIAALTTDLKAKVAAYKAFLAKSTPAELSLFPNGPTYAAPAGEAAPPQAAAAPKPGPAGARP
ncbi:hypothetical protein [Paludisphaera mucosa]|uniref:HEAT repeat domain-containing protein n=1 Tax=Paludisphaera mucosa TaxID=3030827 RepID=A0ABT6F625_9BACT|nr:hypothetical protein [Paludisphaera mucosa]MDG3003036.1 hypothetical protein [Paludisphaera mucosa]